jgi:hypothetical protein
VYATFDGYHIWLDCRAQCDMSIGPSGVPAIALEPPVMHSLRRFQEEMYELARAEATAESGRQ